MEQHRAYLQTICRICAEPIASTRKYLVTNLINIILEAFEGVDGGDITKDNMDTHSKYVCCRCHTKLTRWHVSKKMFYLMMKCLVAAPFLLLKRSEKPILLLLASRQFMLSVTEV